jgi:hypothetical protein
VTDEGNSQFSDDGCRIAKNVLLPWAGNVRQKIVDYLLREEASGQIVGEFHAVTFHTPTEQRLFLGLLQVIAQEREHILLVIISSPRPDL